MKRRKLKKDLRDLIMLWQGCKRFLILKLLIGLVLRNSISGSRLSTKAAGPTSTATLVVDILTYLTIRINVKLHVLKI